ncbi:regulatory protein ral2 [Sesbania bispinosa]|nr:regulatory protein ral2 [Sesbania bispinosa]
MYGELVGIDLSGYGDGGGGGSISQLLSPVICCHLDLRKNGYPIGMRHAIIGDKHYLLGGAIKLKSVEYSDKVYELDTNRCRTEFGGQYVLDITKDEKKDVRTICAVLAADDTDHPISYLFVSIFDVQLIQSINPPHAGGSKLAFRMDMGTKGFHSKPVLDAFLI